MKKIWILIGAFILVGCAHHGQVAPSVQTQCYTLQHEMMTADRNSSEKENWKAVYQQQKLKTEYTKLDCHQEVAKND